MADEENVGMYGYETDEVAVSPFVFGLNAGNTFMTKCEWTPTGGKDGAELEAWEIVFNISGTEKSYRLFPVTKAFSKDGTNTEITDPNAPEMKEAYKDFRAICTHIAHAYISDEIYKVGINRPYSSFKEFVNVFTGLLPRDFATKPLDIFLQWQWQISTGRNRTYLDIPSKMKYGPWLKPAQLGTWEEVRLTEWVDNTQGVLKYGKRETATTDANGVVTYTEFHPITKNGWFMSSNFATQQKVGGASNQSTASNVTAHLAAQQPQNGQPVSTQAVAGVAQNTPTGKPNTW